MRLRPWVSHVIRSEKDQGGRPRSQPGAAFRPVEHRCASACCHMPGHATWN